MEGDIGVMESGVPSIIRTRDSITLPINYESMIVYTEDPFLEEVTEYVESSY